MSEMLRVDTDLNHAIGVIPPTCRIVSFQLSPDEKYLYAACLNGPVKISEDASEKPAPSAKDKKVEAGNCCFFCFPPLCIF